MPRLVGSLFGAVISVTVLLNLLVAPQWSPIFFNDAEFTAVDQLDRERAHRIWWQFSGVLFADKLQAQEFLCVPKDTDLYNHLAANTVMSGISIDSRCEPIDLTDKAADALHPKLITDRVVKSFLYAYDPSLSPTSDQAILVEAHGNVFVLVNVSTLDNLGLLPQGLGKE